MPRVLFKKYCLALVFFGLLMSSTALAQLRLYPIPKEPQAVLKLNSTARTQSLKPIKLPFWDDFSVLAVDANGVATGYPDTAYWVNSNSVWVNTGMGINPPSINVATLDGLDSTNQAYEPTQIFVNGFTDKLASREIDLVNTKPFVNKDSIFLRFFYQWQGNGEAPDKNDYLSVEFKNDVSSWVTVMTLYTKANPDRTVFYDTAIHVINDGTNIFLHDKFQFRFRRYGRKSGPFDTWNIDYVYLNYFKSSDFTSITDRALTTQLSSFIAPYWSMPYTHFSANGRQMKPLSFEVYNLRDTLGKYVGEPMKFSTYSAISNFQKGILLSQQLLTLLVDDDTPLKPMQPLGRVTPQTESLPNPNLFNDFADSVILSIKFALNSGDNVDGKGYFTRYDSIDFRNNDTLYSKTLFYDYYAYDDGTAEYSVTLSQAGNIAALEFNMAVPTDTLVGYDVYFPDFGTSQSQTVEFRVYNDEGGNPGSILTYRPVTVQRSKLNSFFRILINPVEVSDKFYIGWVESSNSDPVKVGLDKNNDTWDKIFVNRNQTWEQNTLVHGSIMIRPIFGSANGVTTGIPKEMSALTIYPNPNDGTFFVKGKYDLLQIINTIGQTLNYTVEEFGDENKITIRAAAGLYLVKIRQGHSTVVKKILIK